MSDLRTDETWHRLANWTSGQGSSERLSAQILLANEFQHVDPTHPLGGPDGGKDAVCILANERWIMAVYFPVGQKPFSEIKAKFLSDLDGVAKNNAVGMAFVTNQRLTDGEREGLRHNALPSQVEIFHLERVVAVLDQPAMASVREQFLKIPASSVSVLEAVTAGQRALLDAQTGGDTFCYLMLYHFNMVQHFAQDVCVIKHGKNTLFDIRIRVVDMLKQPSPDVLNKQWGAELSAPAEFVHMKWSLKPSEYLRIFFHARNGQWLQDLQLFRSVKADCWLAATRVFGKDGKTVVFEHTDSEFAAEFGVAAWKQ